MNGFCPFLGICYTILNLIIFYEISSWKLQLFQLKLMLKHMISVLQGFCYEFKFIINYLKPIINV